uniref:Uncharacterized protein n=1 Tax=Anguilla anguilla TaxID=7936 RepID=A0A0E9UYM4_ANGAN
MSNCSKNFLTYISFLWALQNATQIPLSSLFLFK